VRGFNTYKSYNNDKDYYSSIKAFCLALGYDFDWFNYSPEEDFDEVYRRMDEKIRKNKSNKYNVIISHSMGGGLVGLWVTNNRKRAKKMKKIIYLMPLLTNDNTLLRYLSRFIPNNITNSLVLPKALIIPNNILWNDGNIWNDFYTVLVPVKQIVTMYNKLNVRELDLQVVNLSNSFVIYASEEALNILSPVSIMKIKPENFALLKGKHLLFWEADHAEEFFTLFRQLL